MASKSTFNAISQTLIDNWLHTRSPIDDPELFCSTIIDRMTFKMSLNLLDTRSEDPLAWKFKNLKSYGFTTRVLNLKKWFPDGLLADLPDRSYVVEAVIPHYSRAIALGKPLIDLVQTKVAGINVGYDRLIIPQKTEARPQWCLSFTEGRFMFNAPVDAKLDLVDEEIIQLLIEGETAKDIAPILKLSQRTIEHRIDKMKIRYEARNVVHLTAKLFAIHMDRRMREDKAASSETKADDLAG
jgi:DNA-binding CsgD family transcriptional regulator